jgi:hypothetical protein
MALREDRKLHCVFLDGSIMVTAVDWCCVDSNCTNCNDDTDTTHADKTMGITSAAKFKAARIVDSFLIAICMRLRIVFVHRFF